MLGLAWQHGLVPIGKEALYRALTLNGVAVEKNKLAFEVGRTVAVHPGWGVDAKPASESLDDLISHRSKFLAQYQNARYAKRYQRAVLSFREKVDDPKLVETAARSLFKLMAYKDEYEVARLHTSEQFAAQLDAQFEDGFQLNYHLAPPVLASSRDSRGRPLKKTYGQWMGRVFKPLAALRVLRGTPFDMFGYSSERKEERALIRWYLALLEQCAKECSDDSLPVWREVLQSPMRIRGYGSVKEASREKVKVQVSQCLAADQQLAD
jgi:indolepyruvate ferredoxin oxidoreductase